MSKVQVAIQAAKAFAIKNSPSILTGVGIVGTVTTVVMACKATPKYLDIIEDKEAEKEILTENDPNHEEHILTGWEKFCEGAKVYWPTAVVGGMSIACFIFANSINLTRNAALIAAYQLSEGRLKEYQDKVVETIGPSKEKKVRDQMAQDRINNNPPDLAKYILDSDKKVLCYDSISGRYFTSCTSEIEKAINNFNRRLIVEVNLTLNDWYDELGLEPIEIGDDLGWGIFTTNDSIDVDLTHAKVNEDGTPCIVLDYSIRPMWIPMED